MARKTVRVDVPSSKAERLLQLGKDILDMHNDPNSNSPLNPAKVAKLQSAVSIADSNHTEAKQHEAQAQSGRQVRDTALGIADGQTAQTPDTVLFHVTDARDVLLNAYRGNEEKLSEFGFNVRIGTAKSPTRLKKAA
jgi:hypothetical protein